MADWDFTRDSQVEERVLRFGLFTRAVTKIAPSTARNPKCAGELASPPKSADRRMTNLVESMYIHNPDDTI